MPRTAPGNLRKRIISGVTAAVISFAIIYLGGAFNDAAQRYARAEAYARSRAHTTVGREGYEYIFEPNTHIYIDKILPGGTRITTAIVLKDYLPFSKDSGCIFVAEDVCAWMHLNIFYSHDPTPVVRRLVLYAGAAALIIGAGFYLLSKP